MDPHHHRKPLIWARVNGHGDRQALAVLVLAQAVQSVATAHVVDQLASVLRTGG